MGGGRYSQSGFSKGIAVADDDTMSTPRDVIEFLPRTAKQMATDEHDFHKQGTDFWGNRRPRENQDQRAPAGWAGGRRRSMLRYGSHRSGQLPDELSASLPLPDPEPEPAKKKDVKRDVFGKRIYSGPKYKPADREQSFRPEHVTREAVFKEDFAKAMKSNDLQQLLAVFSMGLDLDASLGSSGLMLATRHEVEAINRRLRALLKKRIDTAIANEDLDTLKATFKTIEEDNLMKALVRYPEVYRGKTFLELRAAHKALEGAGAADPEVKAQKVKALEKVARRAKLMKSMTEHLDKANTLLAREGGRPLALPQSAAAGEGDEPDAAEAEAEVEAEEEGEGEVEGEDLEEGAEEEAAEGDGEEESF